MGILDRINLLIRSNVADLTRRSDSPDRALDRTIGEMESSLREARVQLSRCESAERSLHSKWRRTREEALDWEDKAMESLRLGDEERAREYLVEKHKIDGRSKQLKEELEQQREYIADLARSLDALNVKLESATGRRRAMTSHIDDRVRTDDRRGSSSSSPRYSFPQSWSDDDSTSGKRPAAGSSRRAFAFDEDLRRDYPEDVFGGQRAVRPFQRHGRPHWTTRSGHGGLPRAL